MSNTKRITYFTEWKGEHTMLRPLKEFEFDTYIDFAYELALDLTRSGYPTYCDGMKTKQDFIDRARKSLKRPGEDVLLFVEDGEVEGLIAFEHQEVERYLHAHAFNIRRDTGKALAEFVDYCRERWPGFILDLGFPPENVEAIGWLEGQGVPCIERSWNFLLDLDRYEPLPDPAGVKRIAAENFEDFAAIHRQIQGDMYWNCDRVRSTLDDWAIFVTGEGDAAGEVLMSLGVMTLGGKPHQEIFALDFVDGKCHGEPFQALLAAALNCLKEKGTKWLTFFVDEGFPGADALKALGFRLVGTFILHRLTVF